jgi:hypothetical protein
MIKGTFPYVSQLRLQGKAETIAEILDDRGIAMDEADRARILACPDVETLSTWRHRALYISTISDLFAD